MCRRVCQGNRCRIFGLIAVPSLVRCSSLRGFCMFISSREGTVVLQCGFFAFQGSLCFISRNVLAVCSAGSNGNGFDENTCVWKLSCYFHSSSRDSGCYCPFLADANESYLPQSHNCGAQLSPLHCKHLHLPSLVLKTCLSRGSAEHPPSKHSSTLISLAAAGASCAV
jgi:hypothetical protein